MWTARTTTRIYEVMPIEMHISERTRVCSGTKTDEHSMPLRLQWDFHRINKRVCILEVFRLNSPYIDRIKDESFPSSKCIIDVLSSGAGTCQPGRPGPDTSVTLARKFSPLREVVRGEPHTRQKLDSQLPMLPSFLQGWPLGI